MTPRDMAKVSLVQRALAAGIAPSVKITGVLDWVLVKSIAVEQLLLRIEEAKSSRRIFYVEHNGIEVVSIPKALPRSEAI